MIGGRLDAGPPASLREDLQLIPGYHSPQVEVEVRLNTNESPLPPPRGWFQALGEELGRLPAHRYPDRRALALRGALAEHHGVTTEQVFCANGSNEVLQCLLLAYGGRGRSVAVFEPTYSLHTHIARLTATFVLSGARLPDFTLDLGEVHRVLACGPTITFLCSPNNPSGRAEPRRVVEEVAGAAPGLVVVDEAYGQVSPWSALALLDEDGPGNLAVIRTFSKTWAMAAVRLGYLIGPAPLVADLEQVALPYHLDAIKQAAGRLALGFEPEMRARVALVVEERGRMAAALGQLPVELWSSDANFLLFRPLARDGQQVWEALLQRSVLIRNCSSWPGLAGCLRVTVGTEQENTRFLAALTEVLA